MSNQRLRPSQIVTTFGPGSIVDLPDDSVLIAGIEHWFEGYKPHRKISEPRLQAALRVSEFRTPPVGSFKEKDIPFVRFPRWRVCPQCNRLSNRFRWPKSDDPDRPKVPVCDICKDAKNQPVPTYPARIVVACTKGHIDDFPWYRWVHRGQNCGGGDLFLKERANLQLWEISRSNAVAAFPDLFPEPWDERQCRRQGAVVRAEGHGLMMRGRNVPRDSIHSKEALRIFISRLFAVRFQYRHGRIPFRRRCLHGGDSSGTLCRKVFGPR